MPCVAVEREVEVLAVSAHSVSVRPLAACIGCSGCGGRCALGWRSGQSLQLPREPFGARVDAGQRLRLECEASDLRSSALAGYGLPLLGLVAGALLARGLSAQLGAASDPLVAAGALLGTLAGLTLSKRVMRQAAPFRLVAVRDDSVSSVEEPSQGG